MEHLYHFELAQDPFQNEPDLRFYVESETHRRAQLRIDRALRQSKGLVVLTGEGGTGKSLLARRLFEGLEEEMFESALMVMMQGTADATSVLRRFAAQLGIESPPSERAALIGMLYEQLAIVREDGRHAVLILDDAHVLGREAMAEIGGLLNLEYEGRRLLSLLLVGLPELDAMVASIPSLGERVDVRVPLQPLSEREARAYVEQRLEAAGATSEIFDDEAVLALFKLGGGRPRRINALADNALFEAYLAGHKSVAAGDVENAGRDLAFDPAPILAPKPQPSSARAVARAPRSPAAPPDEALGAATEIAIDEPSDEPLDFVAPAAPARSTAGTPRGAAEATMLMGAFADPSSDDAEADLTSLLDDGDDDAVELAGALAEPDDELPRFGAHNAGGPEAEATRIALPDEEDELELSGPIASAEITDADEIDDLFVELLDD